MPLGAEDVLETELTKDLLQKKVTIEGEKEYNVKGRCQVRI